MRYFHVCGNYLQAVLHIYIYYHANRELYYQHVTYFIVENRAKSEFMLFPFIYVAQNLGTLQNR